VLVQNTALKIKTEMAVGIKHPNGILNLPFGLNE